MAQSITPSDSLLQVRRVAQVLDVTPRHVYRLIQQGDLEAVRLGMRRIRVTRDSLDSLLEVLRRDFPAYDEDAVLETKRRPAK
jgi:excisionase family DNA binding protein